MPRETTRKLSEDTERLLVAGAHLAQGNGDLAADKAALEKLIERLGAKAPPVFARLAEQVAATTSAKPKEQVKELISLAASIAQVRGGLAQLAPVVGEDAPLAAVPEIETPCNAKDLYALHDALVLSGPGRMEKIDEAVERGDAGDLRLVHAVIQAMGDAYVGDAVCDKVVPQFGRAIVGPVFQKLKFPGKKVDGRRLRALVAVEKQGALPLLEKAIQEGSAEMRAAALDAIADHLTGVPELESIALGILEKERTGDVRRAAIRALAGYGSDTSLQQLFEALDDGRTQYAAAEALKKSTHPKVVERLLARLGQAVADARVKVKKGDKEAEVRHNLARALVQRLLWALQDHADPSVSAAVRDLLSEYGSSAAAVMLRQGSPADLRVIADLLYEGDADLFDEAVQAAMRLPADETYDRFVRLFEAKDRDAKLGKERLAALVSQRFKPAGHRWVKALTAQVKKTPRPVAAVTLLGATEDPRAVAPLLAVLEEEKKADNVGEIVNALAVLGDKRALPAIFARLKSGTAVGWVVRSAIVALADESVVDKVREIYAGLKDPDASGNWHVRYLLRTLERKFPGH